MNTRPFFLLLLAVVLLALFGAARADEAPSLHADAPPRDGDGNKSSDKAAISADGRYVAFSSEASDLVAGDANNASDIFVYDRQTGETELISRRNSDGRPGDRNSYEPAISADGRFIAYRTGAGNLLPDYPGIGGVVVTDRLTGATTLASRSTDGTPGSGFGRGLSISADGRYVTFASDTDNLDGAIPPMCDGVQARCHNIYVHDRQTGETKLVSQNAAGVPGDLSSDIPVISADGRFIAFESGASNLLAGNPDEPTAANKNPHVYLYDRETAQLSLVSPDPAAELTDRFSSSPSISADGRLVSFFSAMAGDVESDWGFFVYNRETSATTFVLPIPDGADANNGFGFSISADGRTVTFSLGLDNTVPGDVNGVDDVYVRDLATGAMTLVSRHRNGEPGDKHSWGPALSADGQVIAFVTRATNLGGGVVVDENADIAVHDRATGETTYLTTRLPSMQGNSESRKGTVSADGRFVAFESYASNLVPNDSNGLWDVFVRDMATGRTTLIGRDGLADNQSFAPVISADGRYVAFESLAAAGGAVNWDRNIFVHDRQTGQTTLLSRPLDGLPAVAGSSNNPAFSTDGRTIAFDSSANNLVAGDTNGDSDIFIYDGQTGELTTIPHGGGMSPCCASLSGDGRYVAYVAWVVYGLRLGWPGPDYIAHLYLHDRATGETLMLPYGEGDPGYNENSGNPSLSADGRYVAFHSGVWDLVPGDTNSQDDVFVYDTTTKQIELVSRHTNGTQGIYASLNPSISADGRYVTFYSYAYNLVDNDNNNAPDVFIHDRQTGQTTLISRDENGAPGWGRSTEPSLSPDGEYVVFWSDADLVAGDMNGLYDVFRYDRAAGQMTLVSGVILGEYRALAPLVIR